MKLALPTAFLAAALGVCLAACSATPMEGSAGKVAAPASPGSADRSSPFSPGSAVDDNQASSAPNSVDAANAGNPDYDTANTTRPIIKFGMLVDDLNCTLCHVEVHGDVGSIGDVQPLRQDSHGTVFGRWLVGGTYAATAALQNPPMDGGIQVTGGVHASYNNAGHELPVDAHGVPTFPTIDFNALAGQVKGSLESPAPGASVQAIPQTLAGNALLIGTPDHPIKLHGDVLVQGDVVITGVYTGVGTIYATGNIYVPANVTALNPASFPYPDPNGSDYSAANAQAKTDMQAGKDGLALATARNIFVGDLENYMDASNGATGATGPDGLQYVSLYDPSADSGALLSPRPAIGIEDVYKWLPETKFQGLYQSVTPCWTQSNRMLVPGHQWGERALNRIDAYLYAASAIGGLARATNWTINGGLIAKTMHIISGAGFDTVQAASCGASRINFDYRMQNGLPLLGALAPFFAKQ